MSNPFTRIDKCIRNLIYSTKVKNPKKLIKTLKDMEKEIDKIWDKAKAEFLSQYKDNRRN